MKLVVIDSWQTVEDKGNWFKQKLINYVITNKIIFLITENIPRAAGAKDVFVPSYKKIMSLDKSLNHFGYKTIVVGKDDKLINTVYFKYKDIFN